MIIQTESIFVLDFLIWKQRLQFFAHSLDVFLNVSIVIGPFRTRVDANVQQLNFNMLQ